MPLLIIGPTASGKSGLAVAIARHLGGTVVNGDPFQAIAGLAIGTGQPSELERGAVPHVGYGVLPLSHRPNPAEFGRLVRDWLNAARNPVLVTGSGLYLRGIWDQLSRLPEVPDALVIKVRSWGSALGMPVLHRYLSAVDPARARDLHPNDQARISRALALHLASGQRPSGLLEGRPREVPGGWKVLVVAPSREARRSRVAQRVRSQVEAGWPGEVAALVVQGHREDLLALKPLGYQAWLEGGDPLAIEARIVRETQAYAKRQATWCRNQLGGETTWDPDQEPVSAALASLDAAGTGRE